MNDILQRLPHRPPFVMIDSIHTSGAKAFASFEIKADNILLEDGFFTESGLVEAMAQAAGAGLPQSNPDNAPSVGYIGALKDLRVESLPGVGETISIEVIYLNQVMNAHVVEARVTSVNGQLLASSELKIFLQN